MLNMNKNMPLSASLLSRYLVIVSAVAIIILTASLTVDAFVVTPLSTSIAPSTSTRSSSTSSTSLFAVSALVRKAKEEELRTQLQQTNGKLDEKVMAQYQLIQQDVEKKDEKKSNNDPVGTGPGQLQSRLIKRKGTITVIAEYKRKIADGANGYLNVNVNDSVTPSSSTTDVVKVEANSPELLSGEFREFGAAGIAVLADARMGGCTYDDLHTFVTEQRTASSDVPGSVPIINSDIIVDELQLAQTAALGVSAVVLDYDLLASSGTEGLLLKLAKAARAVDLELIVAVRSKEEAQYSIDVIVKNCGCSFMLSVVQTEGVDAKYDIIKDLNLSPHNSFDDSEIQITTIANILHRNDQGLAEVEETWALRDKGFQCAWISDALYKAGNSNTEHPGAIIQSMGAKSSTRWASPVAKSGRGEGAKEYLGDILM